MEELGFRKVEEECRATESVLKSLALFFGKGRNLETWLTKVKERLKGTGSISTFV